MYYTRDWIAEKHATAHHQLLKTAEDLYTEQAAQQISQRCNSHLAAELFSVDGY